MQLYTPLNPFLFFVFLFLFFIFYSVLYRYLFSNISTTFSYCSSNQIFKPVSKQKKKKSFFFFRKSPSSCYNSNRKKKLGEEINWYFFKFFTWKLIWLGMYIHLYVGGGYRWVPQQRATWQPNCLFKSVAMVANVAVVDGDDMLCIQSTTTTTIIVPIPIPIPIPSPIILHHSYIPIIIWKKKTKKRLLNSPLLWLFIKNIETNTEYPLKKNEQISTKKKNLSCINQSKNNNKSKKKDINKKILLEFYFSILSSFFFFSFLAIIGFSFLILLLTVSRYSSK